jgi:hypothetical protein
MGGSASPRAAELADRFHAATLEFEEFVRGLSQSQLEAMVADEERTVAAMARHIAWAYEVESASFRGMAGGNPHQVLTNAWLAKLNRQNGDLHAKADKQETLAALHASAESTESWIRSLTDEQLDMHGFFLEGDDEGGIVAEWIDWVLIGHIGQHFPAIREATA